MADEGLTDYLARMLSEFAHFDKAYQITDLAGKPTSEVADMMNESSTLLNATSCVHEREVHKHIGDYTLFWTDVYPESLHLLQNTLHKDHLLDYVQQGKSSYYIASTFDYGNFAHEARVLRCLSHTFEIIALGLQQVRGAWEAETSGQGQFGA